jgi:hypothetical protein
MVLISSERIKKNLYLSHVIPNISLYRWVTKKVGRMEGWNDFGTAIIKHTTAKT